MIKICTPFYNVIHPETSLSVGKLYKAGYNIEWSKAESTYIHEGRNVLVCGKTNSLERPKIPVGVSHFLCLDADISFEPEHLKKLLDWNLPIVSGVYRSRKVSTEYVAGKWVLVEGNMGPALPDSTKGFMTDVDWVGAGFLLIKREVFEKLPYPWFHHAWVDYIEEDGTKHRTQTGEDLSFCLLAKKNGYAIACDCDCVVKHHIQKGTSMQGQMTEEKPQRQELKMSVPEIIVELQKNIANTTEKIIDICTQEYRIIKELNTKIDELEKENKELKGSLTITTTM